MAGGPRPFFSIPYYHDYISASLAEELLRQAEKVPGIDGLEQVGPHRGLESVEGLQFLAELYQECEGPLKKILDQRALDRKFIDERVRAFSVFNTELKREISDSNYKTILGLEDSHGRQVMGAKNSNYCQAGGRPIAPIPSFLKGTHVTLFGPPDSAKMAINAMNAYHRKLPGEPAIVGELLKSHEGVPKWGADDEDSKTPLRESLVEASINLTACFDGSLSIPGEEKYKLASSHQSLPIKRFPGLALPSTFLFFRRSPIPLHLYDFALHLFRNWHNPRALVFYVPKLENEEEAEYIHHMISVAEKKIQALHPSYVLGQVRLMIVMENPRAILRTHEIMDALEPYFVGASLGWHDFLASTARIFKEDSHYRIPVKADPNIVIKYIKASHLMLADVVGSRGGIKVGGMYGILPLENDLNSATFQMTILGFFKDVITQLKRDLTGFWVAHPDFVRIGLALVAAWKFQKNGNSEPLRLMVEAYLNDGHRDEIFKLIHDQDLEGLDKKDPNYVRSLIVADIKESDFIPNHHPDEIRYNVFQSLQYLTDWLCGNGCVALPATIRGVPVRVMDDLATAERSRWEVWHELHHKRFSVEEFLKIVFEEMNFIRRDLSNDSKIVQVKWNEETAKWYPIAQRIMIQLMTDPNPPEFATELLMPFTVNSIRQAQDPWAAVSRVDGEKYRLPEKIQRFCHYFEACGSLRFAQEMSKKPVMDSVQGEKLVSSFSLQEILEAAAFHGNIGESKKSLDSWATKEQELVFNEEESTRQELVRLGAEYLKKFGFKFLISAQGQSGKSLLESLQSRIENTMDVEMSKARQALWEIAWKRLSREASLKERLEALREKHGVVGASLAVSEMNSVQFIGLGKNKISGDPVTAATSFELASLSKVFASAFALEYFRTRKIPLESSVNALLAKTTSSFRLTSSKDPSWADQVKLTDLLSHSALNMHYVNGFTKEQGLPKIEELIRGQHGYKALDVIHPPGSVFSYSGGGFLLLEHLIESMEGLPLQEIVKDFFKNLNLSFLASTPSSSGASGYLDSGKEVEGGALLFPFFAAGAFGSAQDMQSFLQTLTVAYQNPGATGALSHDSARWMLHATDRGCREFMACDMGLGIFVAEAGENKLALHQGANEGFRCLFVHCFDGPDCGKGFTLLCNADNKAVVFIAEAAQMILRELKVSGIDFDRFRGDLDFSLWPQEQIVNLGYKALIFSAFQPSLPEKIENPGPLDPLSTFNKVVGAQILSVSNQRFARAENLISSCMPSFDPELFGRQGKVMDSWESARHNPAGVDHLHLQLKEPVSPRYVSLSTQFHDGNQAEFVRLLGRSASDQEWQEILPKTHLQGHSLFKTSLDLKGVRFSQIRVEMYPDGGLSRLGLYEDLPEKEKSSFLGPASIRFPGSIPKPKKPLTIPWTFDSSDMKSLTSIPGRINWASQAFGGSVVKASNEHYGPAAQVVSPFPPLHMFDGLESARSRKVGHFEEVILRLGKKIKISEIELDFKFFVNNNPLFVSLDGLQDDQWLELVAKTSVKAFAGNQKVFMISDQRLFEQVRVRVFPDGGINRIKIFE